MPDDFEDALDDLIDNFKKRGLSKDDIVSVLEIKKMSLEEEC